MTRLLALSIILLSLLFAGCSTETAHTKRDLIQDQPKAASLGNWEGASTNANYEIALVIDLNDYQENISTAWLGYLMARDQWITRNVTTAPQEDFHIYTPHYREELAGRRALVELWKNLRKNGESSNEYLDNLALIDKAGLMEPYVWRYHYQSDWGAQPVELPWVRFDQWMTQRLPGFEPETHGAIKLLSPGATAKAQQDAQTASMQAAN